MDHTRRHFLLAALVSVSAVQAGEAPPFTKQEQLVVDYFTSRNLGKFLLLNEKRGELMAIENGRAVLRVSALSGKVSGDDAEVSSQITPAGFFDLVFSPSQTGADAYMQFNRRLDRSIDVIHPLLDVAGQNRPGRINGKAPEQKRISGGCVNVRMADYGLISQFAQAARTTFSSVDGKVSISGSFLIILPEKPTDTRKRLSIPAEFRPELN